jgi:hypothetical protein
MKRKQIKKYITQCCWLLLILASFLLIGVCIHEGLHALFCAAQGGNVSLDVNWKLPSVKCTSHIQNNYLTFIYTICPYLLDIVLLSVFTNLRSRRLWFKVIPYAVGLDLLCNFWAFLTGGQSDFGTVKNTLPGFYLWAAIVIVLVGFYLFGHIIYRDCKAINWKKLLKP